MPDLLIRDVPEEVVAAIDAQARELGLSRSEYLRRRLAAAVTAGSGPVTVEHLQHFAERFADLEDPSVMERAWRSTAG